MFLRAAAAAFLTGPLLLSHRQILRRDIRVQTTSKSDLTKLDFRDNDRRVFVAVPTTVDREDIERAFASFAVTDIQLYADRGFGFVTFKEAEDTRRALQRPPLDSGLLEVKAATRPKPRERSRRRRDVTDSARATLEVWAGESLDLVCLVARSHVDRFKDYINHSITEVEWVAECDSMSHSMSCSLLRCPCGFQSKIADRIRKDPHLKYVVSKVFVTRKCPPFKELGDAVDAAVEHTKRGLLSGAKEAPLRLRLQSSPPHLAIEAGKYLQEQYGTMFSLSPAQHEVTLSLVSLADGFRCGIEESNIQLNRDAPDNSFNRAERKLSEIFARFIPSWISNEPLSSYERSIEHLLSLHRECSPITATSGEACEELLVGMDLGSAPGGWTKCLADSGVFTDIFSVDPAELTIPSTLMATEEGGVVTHLRMKAQESIKKLSSSGVVADVLVSDMCLHSMEDQCEILASALKAGVLRRKGRHVRGSFVVLTLKCTKGHSKASFDTQTNAQVELLKKSGVLEDVQVFHLMANKKGERTVAGFVQ